MGSRAPRLPAEPVSMRRVLALCLLVVAGCSSDVTSNTPPADLDVHLVEALGSGEPVALKSGRRSPAPFRFRVTDPEGNPLADVRLPLVVEPEAAGWLSQPVAITDSLGIAETYLLEPRPGSGAVVAATRPDVRIPFDVERAPGSVEFEEGTGAVGLPGLAHPDSVLRVRVLDTEGLPMPGKLVFFSMAGALSTYSDTTDADGWVETRIRSTSLVAGDGFAFAFLSDYPELLARTTRPTAAAARRVVLVSIDGLRADAPDLGGTGAFARLARDGASGVVSTVTPSLSVPAHLSMLSGVPPEEHHVFSEDLQFTAEMNALDPAFRISVQRGGDTRAFMAADGPLASFEEILACRLAFGFEQLVNVSGGATAIVDAGLEAVADTTLSAVFLHLPDPDAAGHAHGFGSAAYAAAVAETEAALGRVVDALPEGTLLVVTSDHGGGGDYGASQHGSTAPADVNVPIFLYGPGVDAGATLPSNRTILDVAPTLVWATGAPTPAGYRGAPLLAGFRNP